MLLFLPYLAYSKLVPCHYATIAHIIRYLHIRYLSFGEENGKSLPRGFQAAACTQAKEGFCFTYRIATSREHGKQGLAVVAVTCLKGQHDFNLLYGQAWSSSMVLYVKHIHLLLSEPELDTLADALKSLKQGVARRLIGDAEHFWQKRYYDFNVRNHEQFVEKLHYLHCNPVKAGLCERPEDWPWSSFLHHASGCEGRIEIESEWTARKRERAAGRLVAAVELPHSSQKRA